MKPLIVIPARGGSKGVPGKNIKLLNGKPLIHYTIEAARSLLPDSLIYVSTNDEDIKVVAEHTGLHIPFLRPAHLAQDNSGTQDVLLHAIKFAGNNGYYPDTIILLQPTSPFRNSDHIKEALSLYSSALDMVVSVKETRSNPYYVLFEENGEGYLEKSKPANFTRRQDCPKVWEFNGAIYIINARSLQAASMSKFEKVIKYEMDEISSCDIDTPLDWIVAEELIRLNVF